MGVRYSNNNLHSISGLLLSNVVAMRKRMAFEKGLSSVAVNLDCSNFSFRLQLNLQAVAKLLTDWSNAGSHLIPHFDSIGLSMNGQQISE